MDVLNASGRRINRTHSSVLAIALPWISVMAGSISPWLPVIAPAPVLPPLGFLILLAWRMVRPGLFPLWAGVPLGLFDDLYSGQPLGSGIVLFSLALVAIELIELRFPWRGFLFDWVLSAAILTLYLAFAGLLSGARLTPVQLNVIVPQVLISIVLYPLTARLISVLDKIRLWRVRRLG